MNLNRVYALVLQEFYHTHKSMEVIMDLFFFSMMTMVLFGFESIFLSQYANPLVARYLFMGMLLWEIIRIGQYSMSVGAMWNIWSHNLSNMFITPLKVREYMASAMIAGAIKAFLLFSIDATVAATIFHFNILDMGIVNLVIHFTNLILFSFSIGILILALIFRLGTRIQAIAWGVIYIFQPLVAVFYPVNVLPDFLQKIALAFPATHTFEMARANLIDPRVNWQDAGFTFALNIFYLVLALGVFQLMFVQSRKTGNFAKLEG